MPLKLVIRTSDWSYPIVQGRRQSLLLNDNDETNHIRPNNHCATIGSGNNCCCCTSSKRISAPIQPLQHCRYFVMHANCSNSTTGRNESSYYGCCCCCVDNEGSVQQQQPKQQQNHHRMIVVREMNFVRICSEWDLYAMVTVGQTIPTTQSRMTPTTTTTIPSSYNHCHESHQYPHQYYSISNGNATIRNSMYEPLHFALVPWTLHRHNIHTEKNNSSNEDWIYVGTCRACTIRIDVEAIILTYLRRGNYQYHHYHEDKISQQQQQSTSLYDENHHWHINAYMDTIIDESHVCVSQSTFASQSIPVLPIARPLNVPSKQQQQQVTRNKENQNNHVVMTSCNDDVAVTSATGGDDDVPTTGTVLQPISPKKKTKKNRRKKKPYRHFVSQVNTTPTEERCTNNTNTTAIV